MFPNGGIGNAPGFALDNVTRMLPVGYDTVQPSGNDRAVTVARAMEQLTTGQLIRELRDQRGLSRTQLAVMVGVDPQTIGRWERDEREIHPRYLLDLAGVLRVDPADLGVQSYAGTTAPAWATQQVEQLSEAVESVRLRVKDVPVMHRELRQVLADLKAIRDHLGIPREKETA